MTELRTYSLSEVAAMVLPPEWKDGERWLSRRLNRREIRGYRVGRVWRMTARQVEDLIARRSNELRSPEPVVPAPDSGSSSLVDGLSARSRRRLRSAS